MRSSSSRSAPIPGSLKPKLAKLGLHTDFDLVLHLPLRYEDETVLTPIGAARHGVPVLVEGEVVSSEVAYRPRKQLVLKVRDATGLVFVRFLNFYPSLTKSLVEGARVRLFGEVRPGFFGGEMVHPRFRVLRGPEPLPESLTPVYPATAGVPQAGLRRLIDDALARSDLADTLPEAIRSANAPGAVRAFGARASPAAAGRRCRGARDADAPGVAAHEVRRAARPAALDAHALSCPARAARPAPRTRR